MSCHNHAIQVLAGFFGIGGYLEEAPRNARNAAGTGKGADGLGAVRMPANSDLEVVLFDFAVDGLAAKTQEARRPAFIARGFLKSR